jgi:thioredoxin-like negative regulator of GroEL
VDQFIGLPEESEVRRRIESHLAGLPALPAEEAAKPRTAEPLTQPMSKDWMPPGVKRR